MSDGVPNLRGGAPAWLFWLLGIAVTIAIAGAPALITLVRAPDASRFDLLRDDVAAIKQTIAVMKAEQAGKAQIDDLRNKTTDAKLDQLIGQQRRK